MTVKSGETAATAECEIVSTRLFDFPSELVFKAWTDPEHLARWWGPKGFTNTFHEFDLRPGGLWRFTMHGSKGTDFHNESVFVEIAKPERIVFDHLKPMHKFRVTATFAEEAGKTKLTFCMLFATAAECDQVKKYAAEANEENFDRLESELARMAQRQKKRKMTAKNVETTAKSEREMTAMRVFDAPPELVWKVWTDPKHIAQWWGPNGFRTTTDVMNVRPGGLWRFVMHGPDGRDYKNKIVYLEVEKPKRLVYKHAGDEETEPVNFHVTVTFSEKGGKTQLSMRSVFPSAEELARVVKEYKADEGLTQTLNRLREYLAVQKGGKG